MKNYILQKENNIEETIKQLELILKVRKEQKEIIECAGGWCVNCDPDIKALTESIYILKDYKRVLKEVKRYKNMYEAEHQIHLVRNEQLDRKQKAIIKCNELENENKELKKENEELKNNTRKNENELEFDIDCDWIALQKILDESEKSNEYISYKNEKWIKEKYCIPIQKVKEIIKELEDNIYRIKKQYSNGGENCNTVYLENLAQIKILKQILKEVE